MYNLRLCLASVLVCVCVVAGCSGETVKRVPVFKVSGKVTMAGGPIPGATIAFGPKEGQPVAIGRTNDAGEYSLTTYDQGDGAAKGLFSVTVMKVASSGGGAAEAAHSPDSNAATELSHSAAAESGSDGGNLIPENYSDSSKTPLTFKVEEQENTYDIEIK